MREAYLYPGETGILGAKKQFNEVKNKRYCNDLMVNFNCSKVEALDCN